MNFKLPRLPYREDKLFGWLFAAVLLVPLLFSLFTYESFETLKFCLLLVFTGAGLLVVFLKYGTSGRVLRAGKSFYWFLGLFWLWTALATIFSWDKNYSFFGFYPRFTSGFIFYSAWVSLIFLLNLLDWKQIKFLLKTLVLTSGLVALWGILQSLGIGFYLGLSTDFFNRAAPSFLGNTDFSSMFVVALLPLTVLFLFTSPKFGHKVYYALSAFIQLWSLFIFASRGALVALVAALLAALVLTVVYFKGKILPWLAVIGLIVVISAGFGVWFLNFSRPETVRVTFSLDDNNIQDRLNVWELSVNSLMRRPFFGVGLGNFQLMFEHDRTSPLISGGFFDDAHNLPLELAVTGGIFLLLWFLCLIGAGIAEVFKRLSAERQPEDIALLTGLAAWLAASLFTPVAIPCYVLLGVFLSACFRQPVEAADFQPQFRWAAVLVGSVFIAWGIIFLSSEILFFQGAQSYSSGNYAKAYRLTILAAFLDPFSHVNDVFLTASAIRSGQPLVRVEPLLAKTQKLNSGRAYTYIELANLNYLLLYQTQNPVYITPVIFDVKKAIALDPYSAGNYFSLAAYDLAFGNLSAAQAADLSGLALAPGYDEGEIFLAKTYQLQNNKSQMLDALSKAYQLNNSDLVILKVWHEMQQATDIRQVPFNINLGLGQVD